MQLEVGAKVRVGKSLSQLLRDRHSGDLLLFEVKDGPTHSRKHFRIDALAIKRTWSPPTVIGYEIKSSRSDFLGDKKWPEYLKMCNELYFVTPHQLVKPEEVPADCGLIEASKLNATLRMKKRAPVREGAIDHDTLMYILICRVYNAPFATYPEIVAEIKKSDRAERCATYMESFKKRKKFGYDLSELLSKESMNLLTENENLHKKIEQLEEVQKFCDENNIGMGEWRSPIWELKELFQDLDAEKINDALHILSTAISKMSKRNNKMEGL